jgi:hypothetical protein
MVSTSEQISKVKTQMEYYLSDLNLSKDKFFRDQIQTNKEGWVNIGHFLNCNNIKKLEVDGDAIADACKDSEALDVSEDKLKIRRKDNLALPEAEMRKRDNKAESKNADGIAKKKEGEDRFDENGKFIMAEKDFSDP